MNQSWNEFNLSKPALVTVPIKIDNFVEHLHEHLDEFKRNVRPLMENLGKTSALLSRLIARRKNSFQKMKGFKNLCKLNSALCRILRIDLPSVIGDFCCILPDFVPNPLIKVEMPLKSNFDYVLVRIAGTHKLHQRITECCTESGEYIAQLLHMNFFCDINTLLLAVVAKIWKLSQELINLYSILYENLSQFRHKFPHGETKQLFSKDLALPSRLEKVIQCSKMEKTMSINKTKPQIKMINHKVPKSIHIHDMGVPIDRSSLKPAFDISKVKSFDDIKKFFATENESRKRSKETCVTKRVPDQEWKAIQKLIDRKNYMNEEKRALNIFRKFVSNNI